MLSASASLYPSPYSALVQQARGIGWGGVGYVNLQIVPPRRRNVADAKYRFINTEVGKQTDVGTFQASELYRALPDGKLKLPGPATLPQTNVMAPYVLIGDEAYPLLPFVLKPYSGSNFAIR
ncbi:hypothetical protein RRG08_011347 [Elysia crispata]|uniref:DDE Tnp4 domain-containing protein n=1 Tax=Elysia crispata TaxID=231223 RepID=A0AAE1DP98_9GAST|nr:hypothetical protein RRG08_011347 [Elysia crispata]